MTDPFEAELVELNQEIALGQVLVTELSLPNSALNFLLKEARREAVAAGQAMLIADLSRPEGVEHARVQQNEYRRYLALLRWIYDAGTRADQAGRIRDGFEQEETDYGRSQVHPDS